MLSTDPNILNEQMMTANPGFWASQWGIKLQAGPFTFKGFEYQQETMSSQSQRICYMKARQCFGATINESLKDLHGMITGKYKMGVAHIFPTMDEVSAFSKSIFKPLIASNPTAIGQYVKNVSGSTDTTSLKRVRDSMLFLLGARLGQKVGDTDESTSSKTSAFSADKCVFDEVDFMDPVAVVKYIESMNMSPHKHEVYLGNPSHEDFGIDLIFKKSDQRHWFRKCFHCSEWTCAELSFPGCVKIRHDGTGYVGCDKCGREIPMWAGTGSGEWVPQVKANSDYMHGYRASQLMTPFNDPADILEAYVNPPFGNLADVCRLKLGMAYSDRAEKLRVSDVRRNCSPTDFSPLSHPGPCAMGVDVGRVKHVVIGLKRADGKSEIVRALQTIEGPEAWNQMLRLIKEYNIKSCVVDIRPYEDEARVFQQNADKLNCSVFLCEYTDNQVVEAAFNETTGVVKAHRTGIFDKTHRGLSSGDTVLPARSPEIDEFIQQCCNCAKFEEKDKRRGTMVFRYRPTGNRQEHFRNALNYFTLACSGHRVGTVDPYRKNNTCSVVDNEYERY
jgi:hypothetical protein